MKLTRVQHEALVTMAAHPPERPFVLYRSKSGPMLMRIPTPWLHVPQAQVDRLVGWGMLAEQGPYWVITDTGREEVVKLQRNPRAVGSSRGRETPKE